MANLLKGNVWRIDTTNTSLTTEDVRVNCARLVPATSTDTCVITDTASSPFTVAKLQGNGTDITPDESLARWKSKGLGVTLSANAVLYLYLALDDGPS